MSLTERQSFYAGIWLIPDQQWRGGWSPHIEIVREAGSVDVTAAVRFGSVLLGNSISVGDYWRYVQARRETGEGRQRLQVFPPESFVDREIEPTAIEAIQKLATEREIDWSFSSFQSSSTDVMIGEGLVTPKTMELHSENRRGFARVTSTSFMAAAVRAALVFSMHQPR